MMVKIWNRTGSKIPNKKEAASNGKENLSEEKQKKMHRPTVRNILVLGKTGVGKTSLLNYLYGFDLPVGAGLPKTGKGIHENLITRNGTAYHVFDTWGILLHGIGGDEEAWITQGRTAQVLDNLIAQSKAQPMIVVLTNSEDGFRKQEKIAGMKEYLREELMKRLHHDPQLEIIPVASVAGETLAGDAISRFGRTEVLEAAQYNLADDIEKRLPAIYKMNVMQKLGAWKERSLLLLANGKISFVLNNNSARQLIDLVNYDLLNTFGAIDADGDKMEAEANEYLLAAGGKKPLDRRWRPEFSRITYVKGYEYSKGLSVGLAFDVAASLLRSAKSIRENLSRRVVKTYEAIIESMQKK